MQNWLLDFPDQQTLLTMYPDTEVLNVNSHVHTPYSFSAFNGIAGIFEMAVREDIASLGINDFFVTDGYEAFHDKALKNRVFPLFNIEFIGLMKEEQQSGVRINDPNNPGRCYFCGKGLDFPFHSDPEITQKLDNITKLSQEQVQTMIDKLNRLF